MMSLIAVLRRLRELLADHDRLTSEDRRVVEASREYFRRHPDGGVSFEDVVVERGFTMRDIQAPSRKA